MEFNQKKARRRKINIVPVEGTPVAQVPNPISAYGERVETLRFLQPRSIPLHIYRLSLVFP